MSATPPSLSARGVALASAEVQRGTLDRLPSSRFDEQVERAGLPPLAAGKIDTLQINVGKLCNQTCRHCHVDAGPDRREVMSRETMVQCLMALDRWPQLKTVDITGGAPELNPDFRWLVEQCRARGRHVLDRCNLTVLETAPHAGLAEFLARHRVEVVCSLPHYRALNTDSQRGEGVYEKSIRVLQKLNALGYGDGASGLRLVLVTNPVGAYLPSSQKSLEQEWKRELLRLHGIRFDALYCITNMPISRFLEWLELSGNLESYVERLVTAFNPAAVNAVMCRNLISVSWTGELYDCDFNQMLELPVEERAPQHISEFDLERLEARRIVTARHCFGCTAGAGSSCGGAVT